MATETDLEARCRLARECGELGALLRDAREQLAVWRCERVRGAHKNETFRTDFNGLPIVCEFECTPACGDGWNEPREPASVELIWVWIGGMRMDGEDFSKYWQERWALEFEEFLGEVADVSAQEAYDAFEESRRAA